MADRTASVGYFPMTTLKKYFIVWALSLISLLLLGSLYLDAQRQTQTQNAHQIQRYNQQLAQVDTIMSQLQLLQGQPNQVFRDKLIGLLQANLDQLNNNRPSLTPVSPTDEAASATNPQAFQKASLARTLNQLTTQLSERLSRGNETAVTDPAIQIYQDFQPLHQTIQQQTVRLTESLSQALQQAGERYRLLVWIQVVTISVLIMVSASLLYRYITALTRRSSEVIAQDQAHQRESEETMRRQTRLLEREQMRVKSIVNAAVDAIMTVTEKGQIESFNPAAERLFGHRCEEILGQKLQTLVADDYAGNQQTFIERVMTDASGLIADKGLKIEAVHRDGSHFPAMVSVGEIEQSSPITYTVVFTDLSAVTATYDNLEKTLTTLNAKQAILDEEARLAQNVFAKITADNTTQVVGLNHWVQPMGAFSGDVVLSAELPNGVLRVMLCDFTGHGLPAAIGAVPLSMIYAAMTRKGLPLELLMQELNDKLIKSLPRGIFCSVSCIDVNSKRQVASVWNAGLPSVKLIDAEGRPKHRFESRHLPLGIQNYTVEEMRCETVRFEAGDGFYLFSDGLIESSNVAGEPFGHVVFDQTLNTPISRNGRLAEIHRQFTQFIANEPVKDDVSIIEINTLLTTRPQPEQTDVSSQSVNP